MSLLPVSDAVHCNRSCSALHLFPQTFASAIANVCIPGCKRYPLCGPKNHSFADMGPRMKKLASGLRLSQDINLMLELFHESRILLSLIGLLCLVVGDAV